jgi:fatty-acyl-CoA synthase
VPDEASTTLPAVLAIGDAEREALIFPDVVLTFGELQNRVSRWQALLVGHGVEKGDFVGAFLPTCPEFIELMFAATAMGAVFVPINPRYRARELDHLINDAGLVALITTNQVAEHVDFVARLGEALPGSYGSSEGDFRCDAAPMLRRVLVMGGDGSRGMTPVSELPEAAEAIFATAIEPDDLAMVLYTSGTSANPKGCLLTHRIVAGSAANYARHYGLGHADSFWCPLPIYHVAGIVPMLAIFSAGGAFLTLRRFDAGDALDQVTRWRPTAGLPSYVTIVQDLMEHPRFADTDFSCFRWMNTSPSVQPKDLRERWSRAMPAVSQLGTYGMSEGVGPVTGHNIGDPSAWCAQGLGAAMQGWDVRIVDPDNRVNMPSGQVGEILLRGETLAAGYHRRPDPITDADGWFHTGDLGSIENGQIVFRGRLKDMMKVGGENVAASEIEAVLDAHPDVRLSQVIAIPDHRYVEVPIAFVQSCGAADGEALIAHCRAQLASFKVPRDIVFVDEWPMSTTKIQKFRLRELYEQGRTPASV